MKRLSRRTFLRGAGGAMVAMPLLEIMGAEALAQAASLPKRLVLFPIPLGFGGALNGVDPFWPTGTETAFTLSDVLAPLAAHQADLLVVKNLAQKMAGSDSTITTGHGGAISNLFAGCNGVPNSYNTGVIESGQPGNGITIDQYIASKLPMTAFKTLYLRAGGNSGFPVSYADAKTPAFPTMSPQKAFNDLFANFNPGASSAAQAAAARETARKVSIVDAVKGDFTKLKSKLGKSDNARLDAHLTALQGIELRLQASAPPPATCTVPTLSLPSGAPAPPANGDWGSNNHYWTDNSKMPDASDLHIQVLASALACDLTRVAILEHQCFTQDAPQPWLGIDNMHNLSHGQPDNVPLQVQGYAWYAGQMAKLIAALKAIPEGNGTVFDNTAIVWMQELSVGNHDSHDQPTVIAGGLGGYFKTGRYVSYPGFSGTFPPDCCGTGDNATGQHLMNDLHLTLIEAMGLPPPPGGTFGRPAWCTGTLAGLKA